MATHRQASSLYVVTSSVRCAASIARAMISAAEICADVAKSPDRRRPGGQPLRRVSQHDRDGGSEPDDDGGSPRPAERPEPLAAYAAGLRPLLRLAPGPDQPLFDDSETAEPRVPMTATTSAAISGIVAPVRSTSSNVGASDATSRPTRRGWEILRANRAAALGRRVRSTARFTASRTTVSPDTRSALPAAPPRRV